MAYWRLATESSSSALFFGALGAVSILWVFTAHEALVQELAAYHYGVLAHDCPWCLFAARHYAVGYPMYGALVVVGLEGMAVVVATIVGERVGDVRVWARRRASSAALRIVIAVFCFIALALLPAIYWRVRYGVWIEG
jgi:hypothetical protein